MGLREYNQKRDFAITPEPKGELARSAGNSFVIQKHAASHLHYDFRLEHDGVLKSWSVPKGPSLDPSVKRLAMATEDHPVEYGGFEGIIPKGEYGGGTVLLWDQGTWTPVEDPAAGFRKGSIKFELHGKKLRGRWALVRIRGRDKSKDDGRAWLLVKDRDGEARPESELDITAKQPKSVATGRDLDEIARSQDRVWYSNRDKEVVEAPAEAAKAPKGTLPAFVSPQLATLVSAAPAGDDWLHEMKFDGFRILARKDGDRVQLLTRTGQDWTARFASVAAAVAKLPAKKALIDGEVAVVLPDGTTSFQALQNQSNDMKAGQSLVYFVFDLLHQDGRDLRPLPLETRKAALRALCPTSGEKVVKYTDHVVGEGPAFFDQACKAHLEGIISKRRDGAYITGRGPAWVKTKCVKRQEFVIGGFTEPNGARQGLGALLVGFYEGKQLRYAGKVGTGYTQKSANELRTKLGKLEKDASPFSPAVKPVPKKVHWVAPKLLAEVGFTEMTSDGKLRHPSFQGLREDKPAADVVRERPTPTKAVTKATTKTKSAPVSKPPTSKASPVVKVPKGAKDALIEGVKLTNPERVLYPDLGLTKRDLAGYYLAIADHILPEVADRPLSLVRCPEGMAGQCFYMKHVKDSAYGAQAALRRVPIVERTKTGEYLVADAISGIIALVQMSVLELHTWNSRAATLEQPDRVIIDLDPGPAVPWAEVVEAARAVRARVESLGFRSFVKSTGGKGLHVVVPFIAAEDWDTCFGFSRLVAEMLVAEHPDRYTTAMPKEGREAKILLDYFRNRRGSTAISAYSSRARPGAPVAVPLAWEELDDFSPERPFTVKTLPGRLAKLRKDPWHDYEASRRKLADVLPKLDRGARRADADGEEAPAKKSKTPTRPRPAPRRRGK